MIASTALIAALVKRRAFPDNNAHELPPTRLTREWIESLVGDSKAIDSDAISTTGSQTTMVDDDSTLPLESAVQRATEHLFSNNLTKLIDAHQAIGYIAFGLSDLVFVYPGNTISFLGEELKRWSDNIHNCRGHRVKVLEMSTRVGALQAVQGALSGNTKAATVLTSSHALLSMMPNLKSLVINKQPVVFHVSAYELDQSLVARTRTDAVLAARNTGAVLLSSSTVQEAHDMAIVAHRLAHAVQLPVIHFFDGSSQVIQNVTLATYAQLAEHTIPKPGDVGDVAESLLAEFGYTSLAYQGDAKAEAVLVALSADLCAVSAAVKRLATKVGLVHIRLYRPWSPSALCAALPPSVRTLMVLEQRTGTDAFRGPLFVDVAAAVRFGPWQGDARPRLVSAHASSFHSIGPAHVTMLLEKASQESFIHLSEDALGPLEPPPEDTSTAIFWDVPQDGSCVDVAAVHIAHFALQQNPTQPLTVQVVSDALRGGGPVTQTRILHSPNPLPTQASYMGVHNMALVQEYNLLSAAANKATVLVHGPWTHGDDIEPHLTNDLKLALTQREIRLYALDGERVAQVLGLCPQSTHLVWEVAYLLLTQPSPDTIAERLAPLYRTWGSQDNGAPSTTTLIQLAVDAVAKALVRIELLPTWTILETSDTVLATEPLNRRVSSTLIDPSDTASIDADGTLPGAQVSKWHKAAWQVMFKEAYGTQTVIRHDRHEATFVVRLAVNKRLTPHTYDRNVFHLEFDTTGSDLKYELGDALGVHGHNDDADVAAFLAWYGLHGEDVVLVDSGNGGQKQVRTVFQLFSQVLDLFGRPSKAFYEALASYATDSEEKEQLLFLASSEGKEAFKKRVDDTVTYEDLLREFTSARPPVEALVHMVPSIKPRHYSIASSQKMHNNAVHLLVVAVDWVNSAGKRRYGQCTRYLANLKVGDSVTVSIKPSVMRLPPLDSQPVIMAGLGTGMAPFRAFIQERALAKAAGKEIGPMVLYFGARNRHMEYLYGEELEAYHAEGVLSHMGLAFSRDQKHKVYIQHKMVEDAELLHDLLVKKNGHFYLCGPTWPVPDVKEAIVYGLQQFGEMDKTTAHELIEAWKEKEKYILEVY